MYVSSSCSLLHHAEASLGAIPNRFGATGLAGLVFVFPFQFPPGKQPFDHGRFDHDGVSAVSFPQPFPHPEVLLVSHLSGLAVSRNLRFAKKLIPVPLHGTLRFGPFPPNSAS